jgi:hypothetical protein
MDGGEGMDGCEHAKQAMNQQMEITLMLFHCETK